MGVIYKYENKINHKIYIGKTERELELRTSEHLKNSKSLSPNSVIDKAIKKYGIESFDISIIEYCDSSIINEREQYWIEFYGSFKKGYNLTRGGEGGLKIDYELVLLLWKDGKSIQEICSKTNSDRHSISKILKINDITSREIYRRSLGRPVLQYSLTGEFIQKFESITDAANLFGTDNISVIENCCKKILVSGYNYLWKYEDDSIAVEELVKRYEEIGRGSPKKVAQYDLDGNLLNIYNTCREAAKAISAPYHVQISSCCIGKAKTAYGYKWAYIEDSQKEETKSNTEEIINQGNPV